MNETYEITKEDPNERPCDKIYLIVFGLAFSALFGSMGGVMAYMALTYDIRDDVTSLAEYYHIPTVILSFVLVSVAVLLLFLALCTSLCLGCDCSKPGPTNPDILCAETGTSSTQVLTISRETVR